MYSVSRDEDNRGNEGDKRLNTCLQMEKREDPVVAYEQHDNPFNENVTYQSHAPLQGK